MTCKDILKVNEYKNEYVENECTHPIFMLEIQPKNILLNQRANSSFKNSEPLKALYIRDTFVLTCSFCFTFFLSSNKMNNRFKDLF